MTPCGRKMALKSQNFRFFHTMSHISGYSHQNLVPDLYFLLCLSLYKVSTKKIEKNENKECSKHRERYKFQIFGKKMSILSHISGIKTQTCHIFYYNNRTNLYECCTSKIKLLKVIEQKI